MFQRSYTPSKREFLELCAMQFQASDVALITRAYEIAEKAHAGEARHGGEPYINHPVRIAWKIMQSRYSTVRRIIAALLHDASEGKEDLVQLIREEFGDVVAGTHRVLTKQRYSMRNESTRESIERMFRAGDIDAMIVKIFDRIDNMETLEPYPAAKRADKKKKTGEIFLGTHGIIRRLMQMEQVERAPLEQLYRHMRRLCRRTFREYIARTA